MRKTAPHLCSDCVFDGRNVSVNCLWGFENLLIVMRSMSKHGNTHTTTKPHTTKPQKHSHTQVQ